MEYEKDTTMIRCPFHMSNQKKYLKLLTKNDIINVIGERNVRYKITVN